jgi:Flp pilus assembly protein TadG
MGERSESVTQGNGRRATGRHRVRSVLSRFTRDRSGSTAIEFAALAIPFAVLVFAILESCISFAGQEVMANAADDVARQLRTGQIKAADLDKDRLKDLICAELDIMVAKDCPGLMVDLRNFGSFADAATARFTITGGEVVLTKNGAKDPKQFVVDPGPSKSKNMLRVFYKWPVMTDFMASAMANLNGNATLHYATATWQNEPFDD